MNNLPVSTHSFEAADQMRTLITELVCSLVEYPDAVRVEVATDGDSTILHLFVASDDLGSVVGKQGSTAQALRCILQAAAMKFKRRFSLHIQQSSHPAS